jgi:hypothetical protein
MERIAESKFEWLCSNINLIDSDKIMTGLVDTKVFIVIPLVAGVTIFLIHELVCK